MESARGRSVYKYFPLEDRFVRIRLVDPSAVTRDLDPAAVTHELAPPHDRTSYRRHVVRACVDDEGAGWLADLLEGEVDRAEAPGTELLYHLALSVNPDLDINRVSLHAGAAEPRRARPEPDAATLLRRRLPRLASTLKQRVVGQPRAVEAVLRAARRAAAGLRPERGPLASLLFVGPTGTGKTELARALAAGLFGDERRLVRIDCSELGQAHETSRLVGAPPGYVGHGEGGQLTERLLREPRSVVLFDEVEKAHPRLHQLFLQVLEEGELTDGNGRVARFDEALVLMTSNCGSAELARKRARVGFDRAGLSEGATAEVLEGALADTLAPEVLGRIEEVVPFRALDERDVRRIAALALTRLAARVRKAGGRVRFARSVAGWLASRVAHPGAIEASGARGLLHALRREVEAPLAEELLVAPRGRWVRVHVRRGELAVTHEAA